MVPGALHCGRPAVVRLEQPVDEVELGAQRKARKVHDDIGALSHPQAYLELIESAALATDCRRWRCR